jgi:hypothetical protein
MFPSMFLSMFMPHITGVYVRMCVDVQVRVCVRVRVRMYKCWNAGLSGIQSVRYQNEKTNDAGTGLVPDQAKAVQHFFGPLPD